MLDKIPPLNAGLPAAASNSATQANAAEEDPIKYLDPQNKSFPVRLTKNTEGKVVKVEIYATQEQQREILNTFPHKNLIWKESASHLLLLNSLAAYENSKLTKKHGEQTVKEFVTVNDLLDEKNSKKTPLTTSDDVAKIIKAISHATAPLYALINSPNLNSRYHPLHHEWKTFRDKQRNVNETTLTLQFIQEKFTQYESTVNTTLAIYALNEELKQFQNSHRKKCNQFKGQLDSFSKQVLTQTQLRQLLSHQDESTSLKMISLGGFLRSTAHSLATNSIAALDEITAARFNQLFSFTADPLRKELVKAKSDLEKQRSTNAARFINTDTAIPEGQLMVLNGEAAKTEERWMDVMPYINCKTFLGDGIEGFEGLRDVDQILSVYGGKKALEKKPSFIYQMITGKKGPLGILAVLLLGLPTLILGLAGLLIAMVAVTLIDLGAFLLQAAVLVVFSPLIAFGLVADIIVQIPSFFSKDWEIPFSFLEKMSHWPIPPDWLKETFRDFSLVRIFKQFLLSQYSYYVSNNNKNAILSEIKENQAEGLFNVVATTFFSFSTIAAFLQQKMKQLFYAMREIRKVLSLAFKNMLYLPSGEMKAEQDKAREKFIRKLAQQVDSRITALISQVSVADSETMPNSLPGENSKHNTVKWARIAPWKSRQYETPLDFFSDIGLALSREVVDRAFENNPGLATPAFVASIACSSTLLFPSVANIIPEQIVKGFQFLPHYIAKIFMGKEIPEGLSGLATDLFTSFLQWQLTYFTIEAALAICHGDTAWIKKIFENPEEITLGAMVFITMGYGIGLIPQLPAQTSIFDQIHSDNPVFNALTGYVKTLYAGVAASFNTVRNESVEVVKHGTFGPNALELTCIGLKSTMLVYALISGSHSTTLAPLKLDIQKLCYDFHHANPNPFDDKTSEEEKTRVIRSILQQHGIADAESDIAKQLLAAIPGLNKAFSTISEKLLASASAHSLDDTEEKNENKTENLDQKSFIDARKKLEKLIHLVHNIEILGMPIHLDADETDENTGYQSKSDAELIYDSLYFAIEDHNQCARKLGLFHEQIDGHDFLHSFYNKHCYAGSSGWHKLLFGLLLFPITWIWRGFKYLIGTPSIRHQVKKSFNKDFAMAFQLIPDVIAPILRSFLKALLYATRMLLGILVLPFLAAASIAILLNITLGALLTVPKGLYAIFQAVKKDDAQEFVSHMQKHFQKMGEYNTLIWKNVMCNFLVNGYMKVVSLFGSPTGTGSLHRLHPMKAMGIAAWYQGLAKEADTNHENLGAITRDLTIELKANPAELLIAKRNNQEKISLGLLKNDLTDSPIETTNNAKGILSALTDYDQRSMRSWWPRSSERTEQLVRFSHIFSSGEREENKEAINAVLNELPEKGSRLRNSVAPFSPRS